MNKLPLVVRIPVEQMQFDMDAVDAEVYCVNETSYRYSISTSSESFTTIDEETGETAPHGSDSGKFRLAPGESKLIAVVKGWEWDGHVGIEITYQREGVRRVTKSYDFKSGNGDFTIQASGKKGRVISPVK